MAHHSISHLMLYNAVFIVQTIIGTGIIEMLKPPAMLGRIE